MNIFKTLFGKNIFHKIIIWIIIFAVIILIILFCKRDMVHLWNINQSHKRQGYFICQTFDCTKRNLSLCTKSFFRIESADKYIEEYIYSDANLCVFKILKSDNTGMECRFNQETLNSGIASKVLISNYFKMNELKNNCQLINIPN